MLACAIACLCLAALGGGCEDLRELRELRDSNFGGAPHRPGASGVDVGVGSDAAADTTLPRDSGADVRADAAADASADSVFDPVDAGRDGGPVFDEPPTIFDVFPAVGPTSGGTLVTVQGARFDFRPEVRLGGLPVERVDVVDQYELLFVTPPLPAGVHDLKITTSGGTAAFEAAFTAVEPLAISAVEPGRAPRDGRLPVTVLGEGFGARTRFMFGTREATDVRIVSTTRAELLVPPADVRGRVDVTAFGTGLARLADGFEYYERPRLDALVPSVGPTTGGLAVGLDAAGIDTDCVLWFGASAVPVLRDERGLLTVTPPGGAPGSVDVSVDCGERGASYHPAAFEYDDSTEPRVAALWPAVDFTRGGALVTISGTGLAAATEVRFGDAVATVLDASAYSLRVVAPGHAAGSVDVTAAAEGFEAGASEAFRYVEAPRFGGLRPDRGSTSGGWTVILDGDGLDVVESVLIDGTEAELRFVGPSEVRFVAPPGAPGEADVRVRVAGLEVDTGFDLMFGGELRFDGFEPRSGATTGGTRIAIFGTGFDDSCEALVDGVPAPTQRAGTVMLIATAPPHAAGYAAIEVVGCGDGWLAPRDFVYVDPARIPGGVSGGGIDGEINVTVIEASSDLPIEGATVVVGVRDTTPFVALTDARGQVTFRDESLRGRHTVTAYAPQRSAEAFVNVDARDVTLVLNQIPPPPCDPATDPDCVPPPPPPTGQIIGFLSGLRKIADPPPGAVIGAVIETTRYSAGFGNPSPGAGSVLYDNGPFTITTRLGEMALVAQCGWFLDHGTATQRFVPKRIGVTRGIFIRDPEEPYRTAVDCNIPLDRTSTFKLRGAPPLVPDPEAEGAATYPAFYQIDASWDFGAEGHLETLPPLISDSSLFTAGAFPALEGPLEGVVVDFTAGAYDLRAATPFVRSYLFRVGSYERVNTFPEMLPIPTITTPSVADPVFSGYVEWSLPPGSRVPDFYHFYVSASGAEFPRYSIFVPGFERSINLADFPEFRETIGWIPRPGDAGAMINFYVRAIDVDVFDFDDFDRYALRQNNWRAVAVGYTSVMLSQPGGG